MLTQKCLHKEWLLVKIRGLRGFKIWQCKQCKLILKERTKGFHEVFILKNPAEELDILRLRALGSEIKESDIYSNELNKTTPSATTVTAHNVQLKR
jgi:Zn-finger protein